MTQTTAKANQEVLGAVAGYRAAMPDTEQTDTQAGAVAAGPRRFRLGDNRMTLYTDGRSLFEEMLAAIRSAEHEVCFETFMWKADETGREFKATLVEAADRGVAVFVVFDAFANLVVSPGFKRLPDPVHRIRHGVFAPRGRFFDPRSYGRDHRKILVVDGHDAFVGGFNIGDRFAGGWRDTHLRVQGPDAWSLKNAFYDFWNRGRGPDQPVLREGGTTTWDPRFRASRNMPRMRMFPIRGIYLEAIDRARERIWMTHAYFVPDKQILGSLLRAAGRGVDVRLLLPARSNHRLADALSRSFFPELLRHGVRVFLYDAGMVHAKTATIDGEWSTVGTTNIDRLSLAGNYEINVEIFDRDAAGEMDRIFTADCELAHELDPRDWADPGVAARIGEALTAPLRPLV